MRVRQPESGAKAGGKGESPRRRIRFKCPGPKFPASPSAASYRVSALCGLWDPWKRPSRSLSPPSACTREPGCARCLKPRSVNCLESAPPQVPPFTASPGFSGGGGLHRSALGEGGEPPGAVAALASTAADRAGPAPVLGPREPLGNVREQGDLGLGTTEVTEGKRMQEGAPSIPPKLQGVRGGLAEPLRPQFPSRVPPLGTLKALLRRETRAVKVASWPLWGLFQESLGMRWRGFRGR